MAKDKDAPVACSATKQVSRAEICNTYQRPERSRDPRFDKTQDFDIRAFRASYNFISKMREAENAKYEQEIKDNKDDDEFVQKTKAKILNNKRRLGQQKQFQFERELRAELRKKEEDAVRDGKQEYHIKENKMREILRAAQFNKNTKEKGRKYVEKKYEKADKRGERARKSVKF